jgi:malic enzyme
MSKDLKEKALEYHAMGKPGKIEIVPTKPHSTQTDLGLAYTPGVAVPCLEIEKDNNLAYEYTGKGNLVAVISNGTAVLGLGDIGALAGKPVMEGKALLFKIYAGIDVFDIEINEKDPKKFIEIVKGIAPTFGGINLEDIKAPECFEIEDTLKAELDIPVMHDDQHGTAIISSAGLLNAIEVAGKSIRNVKMVVNGAGAAACACTRLYLSLGLKKENLVMCDSKGVIRKDRKGLTEAKAFFATDRTDIETLEDYGINNIQYLNKNKELVYMLESTQYTVETSKLMSVRNALVIGRLIRMCAGILPYYKYDERNIDDTLAAAKDALVANVSLARVPSTIKVNFDLYQTKADKKSENAHCAIEVQFPDYVKKFHVVITAKRQEANA